MKYTELKKVVIITESVIKDRILKYITSAGAKGYTIHTVCGKGEGGVINIDALLGENLGNIKINIITTEEIADKIAITIVEKFLNSYTGIVYIEDVKVLRAKKFGIQ